jgi:cytochrome P450
MRLRTEAPSSGEGPVDVGDLDFSDPDKTRRLLAMAQARHPWAQTLYGPLLLRYRDVAALLHDPALDQLGLGLLAMSGVTDGPLYEWWSRIMFANEGARHRQLRDVARGWLTPKRLEELRAPLVDACEEVVAGLPRRTEVDLAAAVAAPVPMTAICLLLGVDRDDVEALGAATTDLGMAFGLFDADEHRRILEALSALLRWGEEVLRTSRPGTLARSIADAARSGAVDDEDALALIVNLLFAAQDTTRFLIANALWSLGRHPEWWDALHDGRTTAAAVIEETLRFRPPATGVIRVATAATTIGALELAPGDLVSGSLWAAGRDPLVHEHPDRFDPERAGPPTLSFGHGAHYCIGAALARLEATVAIEALVAAEAAVAIDWENGRMRKGRSAITGIERLMAVLP